ncbi:hypothetical protein HRbin05_00194 [archaeon HR05]|nr:hypothetical protein HRbin05_00194 [archaeon HR05]
MLVLLAGERILFQQEANLTIRYKTIRQKQEGRGILYITNLRVVFEDYKQGIMLQVFPNNYELQAYRRVKGLMKEKLVFDIEKNQTTALVEVEFKDKDKNKKNTLRETEEALNTLLNTARITNISSNSNGNSNIGSPIPITFNNNNYDYGTSSNYNMDMSNNTITNKEEEKERMKEMPEEYRKWISDIKFTWNPDKRVRELGYIVENKQYDWGYFEAALVWIDNDLENMQKYYGFDINRYSPDFRYKVAREAYKLSAVTPEDRNLKEKPDTNVYWVGIIENAYKDGSSELVGVNTNARGDFEFILNPVHWYRKFRSLVTHWYDIERDKPPITHYTSERDKIRKLTLASACKDFYYAILNKDFKKAEEAHKIISETYRKYDSETMFVNETGRYGLVLKYAMEMHVRNIPYPIPEGKKTPI